MTTGENKKRTDKVRLVSGNSKVEESIELKLRSLEKELDKEKRNQISGQKNNDSNLLARTSENALSETSKNQVLKFWSVLVICLLLAQLPYFSLLFTPLKQFAVYIHELGHAVGCVLTGGNVAGLTIVSDGQGHAGLTHMTGGIPFIYIQSGYLGTTIFGCLLIYLSKFKRASRITLFALGSFMLYSTFSFMLPGFALPGGDWLQIAGSLVWGLLIGSGIIWGALKLEDRLANLLLLVLATFTASDSLSAIAIVIGAAIFGSNAFSDATVMEGQFFLPAAFWAISWAILSIGMVLLTLWYCYGPGQKSNSKSKSSELGIMLSGKRQ